MFRAVAVELPVCACLQGAAFASDAVLLTAVAYGHSVPGT